MSHCVARGVAVDGGAARVVGDDYALVFAAHRGLDSVTLHAARLGHDRASGIKYIDSYARTNVVRVLFVSSNHRSMVLVDHAKQRRRRARARLVMVGVYERILLVLVFTATASRGVVRVLLCRCKSYRVLGVRGQGAKCAIDGAWYDV